MDELARITSIAVPNGIQGKPTPKEGGEGFEAVLKDAVTKVNSVQNEAEKAIQELSNGGDISSAVIAMEKADVSFQLMIEVRNKLISAYEEMMRLQI